MQASPPIPADQSLPRPELLRRQRDRLTGLWRSTLAANSFYQRKYAALQFDPARDPLDTLPFTTRGEFQSDQAAHPPFGSNLTFPIGRYVHYHQTSGSSAAPMRWLDTAADWDWWRNCWGVIFGAMPLRDDDRLMFPFSHGPFVGFWAAFDSARALGRLCIPAGGLSTSARLDMLIGNGVTVVGCTPTYALRMADAAESDGVDLAGSAVRALILAGEPGGHVPATRARLERAWGARVFDHWGMTEVGPLAFEAADEPGGLFVNELECIAEVIDPAGGAAAAPGAIGELVITNLGRAGSPAIRYRTGDLVRWTPGRGGRTWMHLEGGVLGRADDMVVVRGNNVFPSAIEDILRSLRGIAEYRVTLAGNGPYEDMRIEIEPAAAVDGAALAGAVERTIRDRLYFRPTVRPVAAGSLPRFEMKARRWVRETAS